MKSQRKKLIDKLDQLTKEYCRVRDNWVCQWCGKDVDNSNAHRSHVIPVSHGNRLRWDERNYKLLCFHCHMNVWHKSPLMAQDWFKSKFHDRWLYLTQEAVQGTKRFSLGELQAIIDYYNKLLEK